MLGLKQVAGLEIFALILSLTAQPVLAQTDRTTEIIERALVLRPDKNHGKRLYQELCASCHGDEAYGRANPVTPALAGQLPIYLIKQLVDFSEGHRTAPDMHGAVAVKQLVSPQSLSDVSSYLSDLPTNPKPEVGEGKDLAASKRYYVGLCAFCHGSKGEGNEAHATPALRGQHYSYVLIQTRRLVNGHRYSVPVEILEVLDELSFDEMTQIADYISRLPVEPPGEPTGLHNP